MAREQSDRQTVIRKHAARHIRGDKHRPPFEEPFSAPPGIERQAWYQIAPPEPSSALMAVGWTLATYAIHMEAMRAADLRFDMERDRRYTEVDVEKEKALKIKETADLAALGLAREIQTYKDEKANELREQISSERGLYATKGDLQGAVEKIEATLKPMADYIASDRGKNRATDPSQNRLLEIVDRLDKRASATTGASMGIEKSWLVFIAVAGLVFGLWQMTHPVQLAQPAPQVIMVPAPNGTLLPSTPPQAVPR